MGAFNIFSKKPCSKSFQDIFTLGHRNKVTCEACGRVHFSVIDEEYDSYAEISALKKLALRAVAKYIPHQQAVPYTKMDGKEIVLSCPCNFARQYEEFVKTFSSKIEEYHQQILENA